MIIEMVYLLDYILEGATTLGFFEDSKAAHIIEQVSHEQIKK